MPSSTNVLDAPPAPGSAQETVAPVRERRVLLFAPTGNDARLTATFLKKAGFPVEQCVGMAEVAAKLLEGCGVVVLAEETLGKETVGTLMQALEQQPSWSDLPIAIITGGGEAARRKLRKLITIGRTSNIALLERPFHPETLLSTVEVAWRARQRQYQVRNLLLEQLESRQHLQGILEGITDSFAAIDKNWRFSYMNDGFRNLARPFYDPPEQLLGENIWSKFPQFIDTPVGHFYRQCMKEQKPGVFEFYYEQLGMWLSIHAYPSPDMLSLFVQDVTAFKKQQDHVRELNERIKAQAKLFDATLSHMADLAYTLDCQGRFLYANEPLLDLLGLPAEEVVGKNVFDLNFPDELARKLHGQMMQVIETGKPVQDETIFTGADGKPEHHEYIYNPVFGPEGKVVAIAGTTRLITQRKLEEAQLKEAKETAEAANRAKDRFLAVLSHELRTPLTPVLMTVSALEVDPEVPFALRGDVAMIRRNVELETKLIDDLLDLSRITTNKLTLRLEHLEVNECAREVASICRPQILEKSIHFVLDLDDQANHVNVDPARFQQVLWNVVKNAVKFTPERGEILLTTRREGDTVSIQVRDNGKGIAESLLPRIFEAFEQGDPGITRTFGGLGLGLAISRALVELHGGAISAASDGEGKGSTFTITLPAVVAPKPAAERGVPFDDAANAQHLRLLVVEDHADTVRTLGLLLRRAGFVVTTAQDIATALRLAEAQTFDLLVSDVGLPDGTGFDLMREISKRHAMPGIAMSGYGLEEDVSRSFDAGFSEHLVKPVRVTQLEQAVRRVMARK